MICKITRGARAGDIASYLHGPGHANEHRYGDRVGGAVIGGNIGYRGDRHGIAWAKDLRAAYGTRPDIAKPVWQMSMRCAPGDRVLTDREWRTAVTMMAERMGFEGNPYVVVRHSPDHVHVVMSRVSDEGVVWYGRNDAKLAQQARVEVEQVFGLRQAPTRRRPDAVQLTSGEMRRQERTGRIEPRSWLAQQVRAARDAARGRGRAGFEEELVRRGVGYRANVAATGRMAGYSFHAPQHEDAVGAPVWWRASQLARELSWGALGPEIEPPVSLSFAATPRVPVAEAEEAVAPAVDRDVTVEEPKQQRAKPPTLAEQIAERSRQKRAGERPYRAPSPHDRVRGRGR